MSWHQHLRSAPPRTVVAQVDGPLVAAGRVEGDSPDGVLRRIAVHPDWQPRGVMWPTARRLGWVYGLYSAATVGLPTLSIKDFMGMGAGSAGHPSGALMLVLAAAHGAVQYVS